MLHILNGDATANILKETDLPGELLPWREALVAGPTPGGLSFDDWIHLRAKHLARDYEQTVDECKASLLNLEEVLRTFSKHEEVVLWFEHDLFCQINLIYLLNFFSQQKENQTGLSLICIDDFPGIENFKGLGQLSPSQLASLFEQRQNITQNMLELGQGAWAAYCSPTPTAIETFLQKDCSELSFLKEALLAHLVRFPALKNGLGRVEKVALDLINGGIDEFKPLFPMFGELEPVYGFGDAQFWNHLKCLSKLKAPLIIILGVNEINRALSNDEFTNSFFKVTEKGKAILNGEEELQEIDSWLGGVHLNGETDLWRWDEQNQRLVKKPGKS
ncbi:RNA polymerase subunit sigma-24 [candidate division KSB1 bacterium]|nr:RNA polymerase subunit sigma-24 [candidate division KSB1 bacterium]